MRIKKNGQTDTGKVDTWVMMRKKSGKSADVYPRWGKACVDTWGDDDEIIMGNESHMELTMK